MWSSGHHGCKLENEEHIYHARPAMGRRIIIIVIVGAIIIILFFHSHFLHFVFTIFVDGDPEFLTHQLD